MLVTNNGSSRFSGRNKWFLLHLMAKLAHMLNDQSSQKFDSSQYKIMTKIPWLTFTIDLEICRSNVYYKKPYSKSSDEIQFRKLFCQISSQKCLNKLLFLSTSLLIQRMKGKALRKHSLH